jgi:hypothetical protein
MSFFSKEKDQDSSVRLVCEISSDSVHLCLYDGYSPYARILYYRRTLFSFSSDHSHQSLLFRMQNSLKSALQDMFSKKIGNPKSIDIILSSPWFASQTRIVHISEAKPFILLKKKVDDIIEHEVRSFESTVSSNYTDEYSTPALIEKSIMSVKVNGYGSSMPFNKKIRDLEFSLELSASPSDVLDIIENAMTSYFSGAKVTYYTSLSIFYKKTKEKNKDGSLLISNIGGEVTDIAMVRDGVLMEHISFPLGIAHLVDLVGDRLQTIPENTVSIMHMYVGGMLDLGSHKKIENAVSVFENNWQNTFFKSLSKMSESTVIPEDIYINTAGSLVPWFKQMLEKEQFTQVTLTKKKFNVILLDDRIRSSLQLSPNQEQESFVIQSFLNRF